MRAHRSCVCYKTVLNNNNNNNNNLEYHRTLLYEQRNESKVVMAKYQLYQTVFNVRHTNYLCRVTLVGQ